MFGRMRVWWAKKNKANEDKLIAMIEKSIMIDHFDLMNPHQQAAYLLRQIKNLEARIRMMDKEIGMLKSTIRLYRDMMRKTKAKAEESKTV